MFRLTFIVALMTNAVVVGSLIVLVLTLGWVNGPTLIAAIGVGFLISWPLARVIARWIKAEDPGWDEEAGRPVQADIQRRQSREAGRA